VYLKYNYIPAATADRKGIQTLSVNSRNCHKKSLKWLYLNFASECNVPMYSTTYSLDHTWDATPCCFEMTEVAYE
jgi:hypothetical protein